VVAGGGSRAKRDNAVYKFALSDEKVALFAGTPGQAGGGEKLLSDAVGVAVDSAGNVYVADNGRMLRIGQIDEPEIDLFAAAPAIGAEAAEQMHAIAPARLQGIAKRVVDGTAASAEAKNAGAGARPLAAPANGPAIPAAIAAASAGAGARR
jgi:hypothetical protein